MRAQDFADLAESRNVFVIPTARGVADIEVCVASADERATQHRNDGELEPELHPERLEEQRGGARHRGRQTVDRRKWGRNHFLWKLCPLEITSAAGRSPAISCHAQLRE